MDIAADIASAIERSTRSGGLPESLDMPACVSRAQVFLAVERCCRVRGERFYTDTHEDGERVVILFYGWGPQTPLERDEWTLGISVYRKGGQTR